MTYEPPARLVQLRRSPYLSLHKHILTNLFPSSISVPRLFLSATLFHTIIVGELEKLQNPFHIDGSSHAEQAGVGKEGFEQRASAATGGRVTCRTHQEMEKQREIQHGHEDEET